MEKASENPELIPELEAQVKAGGKNSLLSAEKVPQWASWALKALSGKFYKSTTPTAAPAAAGATAAAASRSANATPSALTPTSGQAPSQSASSSRKSSVVDADDYVSSFVSTTTTQRVDNVIDEIKKPTTLVVEGDLLDGWGDLNDDSSAGNWGTTSTAITNEGVKKSASASRLNEDLSTFSLGGIVSVEALFIHSAIT